MLRGLIFDLDGVVTRTEMIHFHAWREVFSSHGVQFDLEDYFMNVDGKQRWHGIKSMLPNAPEVMVKRLSQEKQALFKSRLQQQSVGLYDDAVTLIHSARGYSLRVALASSSSNAPEILRLTGIGKLFDAVVIPDGAMRSKPAPDIFLKAAVGLGATAREIVVFEDACAGLLAAKNAGMCCVGVRRHPAKILDGAPLVVNSLEEVDIAALTELLARTEGGDLG
ncbi:beta-phosphoglucomutase family hydrolase [bacterium]|nr:beta-phosphoglucomutase family hydrolase [candidate division CSSED10-310 bacterium]